MTSPTQCLRLLVLTVLLLQMPVPARAETWRVLSTQLGVERPVHAASTFADRVDEDRIILSNRPPGPPATDADLRVTIGFVDAGQSLADAQPVHIDAEAGTINLGSIFATGWRAESACRVRPVTCGHDPSPLVWVAVIGWDFGPVQALPLVKTADDGGMASWNAVASRVSQFDSFGSRPIQFTFAPALPAVRGDFVATERGSPPAGEDRGIAPP